MKTAVVVFCLLLLLSCENRKQEKKSENNLPEAEASASSADQQATIEPDSVWIPPFEIEIALSEKAKDLLESSHESVIVFLQFTGEPGDTTLAKNEDHGPYIIKSYQREIFSPWKFKVENLKMSKKIYNKLTNKNYDVLAQIWTGRHSSENNLLNGDLVSGTIDEIKNKKHTLAARLIRE
ncbi:MAG: hypothetical protein JST43_12240 [Bacteroidetes bacterium]|nr:hypothetical protein [Bacteroidota bacterium]MBS1541640.1 hypothetical protein [Bacteroidota bacterium]